MTRYAGRTAVVVGEATAIGLAVAKRLVEGGAQVVLTARTEQERHRLCAELGSTARVVALSGVSAGLCPGGVVDLLFADAVATARPLLPRLRDGSAVVLMTPEPSPGAVRALAAELVSRGVRVNAVAPGCIETQGGDVPGGDGVILPPLGRLGAAEEVARAALFLATDATFTTGVRLPVDGGICRP